ncbi:hypothetical protein LRX75_17400 [Rhizobium sp. DKSPLA3]|uniref:SpoVT-AbrB domain-containing protein n=1 Tax=Rhizobium quercicola TaxID=2901226 RepID=A0A9X1NTM8_9HYPH|nr:hypothetical protein [Rhizobium quercicola]MCD7110812.1 hypothetical protein [Rhizobium quercicola]
MVELPRALRDAIGLVPGGEVDITESAGKLVVVPVGAVMEDAARQRTVTMEQLLAMALPYDGPPITDEMMHRAIDAEAIRMWAAFEKQSTDDAND